MPLEVGVAVRAKLVLSGHHEATIELTPTQDTRVRHVFQRKGVAPSADPVERKVDHYLD